MMPPGIFDLRIKQQITYPLNRSRWNDPLDNPAPVSPRAVSKNRRDSPYKSA